MNDDLKFRRDYYRYGSGFLTALVLTYLMYFSATGRWFAGLWLGAFLLALALGQIILQLVVFLHVGRENGPRWTLISIFYMCLMVLIVAVATLWIMANMNYNMHMSPEQMEQFMLEQNKKGF